MTNSIKSTSNRIVQHLRKVQKNRQYRVAQCSAIIQGKKNFYELLPLVQIKQVLCTDSSLLPEGIDDHKIFITTESVIKSITNTASTEGIIAEVTQPQQEKLSFCGKTLVLDRIQDPGNLGTLVRTACAFGWDRVITLGSACDFFNDKVIRSSKGAVFKIPCLSVETRDFLDALEHDNVQVYVGDLEGTPLYGIKKRPQSFVLVLGSEAKGPSAEIVAASIPVTIPIDDRMESLNVGIAGGIMMSHLNHLQES